MVSVDHYALDSGRCVLAIGIFVGIDSCDSHLSPPLAARISAVLKLCCPAAFEDNYAFCVSSSSSPLFLCVLD